MDLSFKVRHAGLRRVWVPGATAYDLVNRHKVAAVHRRERRAVGARWTAPMLDEYAPAFGAWHLERIGRSWRPVRHSRPPDGLLTPSSLNAR